MKIHVKQAVPAIGEALEWYHLSASYKLSIFITRKCYVLRLVYILFCEGRARVRGVFYLWHEQATYAYSHEKRVRCERSWWGARFGTIWLEISQYFAYIATDRTWHAVSYCSPHLTKHDARTRTCIKMGHKDHEKAIVHSELNQEEVAINSTKQAEK